MKSDYYSNGYSPFSIFQIKKHSNTLSRATDLNSQYMLESVFLQLLHSFPPYFVDTVQSPLVQYYFIRIWVDAWERAYSVDLSSKVH